MKEPSSGPLPPSCAGRYRAVRLLGTGGHGTVWQAEQLGLRRMVALKLLHTSYRHDAELVARFANEARATAALSHPHVVVLLDHGIDEAVPWIAYELLPGRSLLALLEGSGPQAWPEACGIVAQLASALEAAHALGILHRDLKPANVLEASPGVWKVADFGIAKWAQAGALTRPGDVIGTPHYLAPELLSEPATELSDVYALGLILLELLAGQLPVAGNSTRQVFEFHQSWKELPLAVRPAVPPAVQELVRLATAPDPAARPAGAHVLRQMLQAALRPAAPTVAGRAANLAARSRVASSPGAAESRTPWRRLVAASALLGALALILRLAPRPAPPALAPASAATAPLLRVEAEADRLERRYRERGRVYVRIGQLERGDGGAVDLLGAERLDRSAAEDEQVDLTALASADAELDPVLAGVSTDLRALLARARVRALTFLDAERLAYARHDAAVLHDANANAGGGGFDLMMVLPRLDERHVAGDGVVRLRQAHDAALAALRSFAAELPPCPPLPGALALIKELGHHAHDARWADAALPGLERQAAAFTAALTSSEPPARDAAELMRALWLVGWDGRGFARSLARVTAARAALRRLALTQPGVARLDGLLPPPAAGGGP